MLNRRRVFATLAVIVMLLAGLSMVSTFEAGAAPGHSEKKLFDTRWYQQVSGDDYQTWMTLSTSQLWPLCGASASDCESRWIGPAQGAVSDWNSQDTTVDILIMPDVNVFHDINIYLVDTILDEPNILGFAPSYDALGNFCFANCTIRFGEVYASDLAHAGLYGGDTDRQGTIAHELGHLFALAHESVDYPCGQDSTGVIPHSIMAYNCTDPVPFGLDEYWVQPWDACGVNHAYYDPTIGYAGCGLASPTPTPSPTAGPTATQTASSPTPTASPSTSPSGQQETWGDWDCDSTVGTRDSQALLRKVLQQNALSQTQPCPLIGATVTVDGNDGVWGDADCDDTVGTRDSQALLRKVLQQNALSQTQPCPVIGATVLVG